MNTTAAQPSTPSQARSFSTVFLIEMWERFGYYGMQALIVYYMVQRLNFPDERATLVWGAAAALIYVAPAIGGWIGDQHPRHPAHDADRRGDPDAGLCADGRCPGQSLWFLYCALGVIVVGNGLFKANAGNLVRKIYEGDDAKIDSAFTIVLHGGQPRRDDLATADAVAQGLLRRQLRQRPGLAHRVRGLRVGPGARPAQLRG